MKLDFQGMVITYYADQIAQIKKEPLYSGKNQSQPPEQIQTESLNDWDSWISRVNWYFEQVAATERSLMIYQREFDAQARQLRTNPNKAGLQNLLSQTNQVVNAGLNKFKGIKPPAELIKLHRTMTESFRFLSAFIINAANGNLAVAKQNLQKSLKASVAAADEQIKIYKYHGAPDEIINALQQSRSQLKQKAGIVVGSRGRK